MKRKQKAACQLLLHTGLLVFLGSLVCAAHAAELSIPNVKALPGARFIVPVRLSGGEAITGLQFRILLEPGALSLADTKAPLPGDLLTDHSPAVGSGDDSVYVTVLSSSLSGCRPGAGTLVYLILQLAPGLPVGQVIPLPLADVQAAAANGTSVAISALNGAVTVGDELDPPAPGAHETIFPQFADGSFPGGRFQSTLVFVNRTSAVVSGRVLFFQSNGTAFPVRLVDGRQGSEFSFTVPDGGSIFLETDGSGPLATGYARLTASGPLGGTILFGQRDGSGRIVLEAGVGASACGTRFSIPVLYRNGVVDTGVAFANISGQTANLSLTLRDLPGAQAGTASFDLPAGQHLPKFASELFNWLAGQQEFSGTIEAVSDQPVSAVALKLQGLIMTTFPVIPTLYTIPAVPEMEVTPSSLDFGTVYTGSTKALTFAVKNKGDGELTVQSITDDSPAYSVTSPGLPFAVAPGAEQTVTVTFSPVSGGTAAGTVTVTSDDPVRPSAVVSVTGIGNPGTAPGIQAVTITPMANFSLKAEVQLSDPDGDMARIDFFWYLGTALKKTSTLTSPGEVNLANLTSGTISCTFTDMGFYTIFGTKLPDKVEVQVTDARGLTSGKFVKTF